MKFTLSEISTLQKDVCYGPYYLNYDQKMCARSSITNYKSKWPGSSFITTSAPLKLTQPDGEEVEVNGWFEFYVKRTSFGRNPNSGDLEPLAKSTANAVV